MDKKPSDYIDEFLTFLREAWLEYHIAQGLESDTDKESQDILHWVEFHCGEPVDEETSEKIQRVLGEVRQRRRQAKNTQAVMKPVIEWLGENGSIKKSLEQLLGSVHKAEKYIQNQHYTQKTDIMSEILGPPKEATADEKET